jgi:hypothetical protein
MPLGDGKTVATFRLGEQYASPLAQTFSAHLFFTFLGAGTTLKD